MKRVRPLEWLVILAVTLALGAAILWPVQGGHPASKTTACLSNVKEMGLASVMYSMDENDRSPLRDVWMDALVPYSKNEAIYHCPLVPKTAYGYALDSRRSGRKPPQDPARATLIFESVNPIRNASDPLLSLPYPGRHPGIDANPKAGRNTVGFADGHSKAVPGGQTP